MSILLQLLIEVEPIGTKDWPLNLIQMLLLGASVIRFLNEFLEQFRMNKQFVLIAMFIKQTS